MSRLSPYQLLLFSAVLTLSTFVFADARIVAIEGKGKFHVDADQIDISISVSNTSISEINLAKQDVERRSSSIVKALLKLGIDEDDVVSPQFRINAQPPFNRGVESERWVPQVSRVIDFEIKNIESYNAVLNALVQHGVTTINSVQPRLVDPKPHERKALELAIENAKKQADFLAESFGSKIKRVHSIGNREYRSDLRMQETLVRGIAAANATDSVDAHEFKPGPVVVEAVIRVEFELE